MVDNTEIDKRERKVTVEVDFKYSMADAIGIAAKLLYFQEQEDEYGANMYSERKGNKVVSTMTFKKKKQN